MWGMGKTPGRESAAAVNFGALQLRNPLAKLVLLAGWLVFIEFGGVLSIRSFLIEGLESVEWLS